MVETFVITEGDTEPSLRVTFTKPNGTAYDLSGHSGITFALRRHDTETPVALAGNIVVNSAPAGDVEYRWHADDLLEMTPGRYEGQFRATLAGGGKISFPNHGFIPIVVHEDAA